ncbi:MAG: putative metal transport system ATP-binding protein [Candidatus Parcubacteria bacterium]|nr:MAG: putative metal transport system ATP-binding protein [Candidatus Parcubacteria bacterium]
MNALEVKNLIVKIGEQEIIRNISFVLPEGTITALIGPNGAGKSVLLKTILGLFPYYGEIKIFGENHLKMLNFVGYVPQNYTLDPILPLTVFEFLKFSNRDKNKINAALKETDIYELKNRNLVQLSGGQLQRVLFARAILNEPKILLLDEPVSETDIVGKKEFYEIIKYLNQEKKVTILITSHEITIIHTFAQRVLCLNRSLVCVGSITELFKEEILKQLYQRDIFVYPFNRPNTNTNE